MSMNSAIATPAPLPRRRWTDEEFDQLVGSGVIREGSRTFLWDGEIIEPMVEDNPHFNAVDCLRDMLKSRLPAETWTVRQNAPIRLALGYRPQPDLSVIRGSRSTFRRRGRWPEPADIALVVEVSDTTYYYDSGEFLRKYAEEGISQYWIVNIPARQIEVYAEPDTDTRSYRDRKDYGLEDSVPLSLLDIEGVVNEFAMISVRDVLQDSLEDA
jgi:Uma2 family endonuclease